MRTIHASATLFGTWQLGRNVQYVVGLAQTAALPIIASGISGNVTTPVWTAFTVAANSGQSAFAPLTASRIFVALQLNTNGGAIVAPNNSYGGQGSSTNAPPLYYNGGGTTTSISAIDASLLLESTSIYYASSAATNYLQCLGWEDNL